MLNEKVKCLECGKYFKRIDFHIKSHNLSSEEYRRKYGANAPLICDKILKDMSEKYVSPRSIQYYINKGFTETEAKAELKKRSKENSPFCEEFYLKRGFNISEAKAKITELNESIEYDSFKNKNHTDYWASRGFSLEEAKQKISKFQSLRHQTYLKNMEKLGFSEKEALAIKTNKRLTTEKMNLKKQWGDEYIEKFNERRDTLSLKSFQRRWGSEKGYTKYKEYWDNAKPSHFSKEYYINLGYSENEAQAIISKKNSRNEKFFISKYGEVEGKQKYKEFIQKTTAFLKNIRCSKIATELFDKLKNEFNDLNFRYAENEVKITDFNGNNYYIDCVIDNGKKFVCIEFNGDFWHANPKKYQSDEIVAWGKTAQEIWKKDENKSTLILEHFDDLKIVWESEINLNELIDYIKGEFYENQH